MADARDTGVDTVGQLADWVVCGDCKDTSWQVQLCAVWAFITFDVAVRKCVTWLLHYYCCHERAVIMPTLPGILYLLCWLRQPVQAVQVFCVQLQIQLQRCNVHL